jgi:hypothetical protein
MRSVNGAIRKVAVEVIESEDATVSDKLKACGILLRVLGTKGKPLGRGFARKPDNAQSGLDRLLEQIQ